jgi:hypothetical protein
MNSIKIRIVYDIEMRERNEKRNRRWSEKEE